MDPDLLVFQEDLHDLLRERLKPLYVAEEMFFPDVQFEPTLGDEDGVYRLRNIGFVFVDEADEPRYRDSELNRSHVEVKVSFEAVPTEQSAWTESIQRFDAVLVFDDVDHREVIQWERRTRAGRRTGRLKLNDERVVSERVDADEAVVSAVRLLLSERLPQHAERYGTRDVPPDRIVDMFEDETFRDRLV